MEWLSFILVLLALAGWAARSGDEGLTRTSAALCANWTIAIVIVATSGDAATWPFLLILDGLTAAAVMAMPAGRAQAAIGGVLISQMLLHSAYGWIGNHPRDVEYLYLLFLNLGGWLQLLLLAGGLIRCRWQSDACC